ncbi:MAG: C40 family peptidase, partial [Lachnospiraceae bacterium]|nr:C40 family peptidase [Lachnospiraceae bacterium]
TTSAPSKEPMTSAPAETSEGREPSTETSAAQPETETLPSETVPETDTSAAAGTQTETIGETTLTELQTDETGTEEPVTEETETESEEKESETSKYKSNEELIAHQKIVVPPKIELEFRFSKVDKRYAIVRNDDGAKVYEKKSEDSRAVGELEYYGSCYILDDQGDGWYYIESGNVRGFVKAEDVVTDEVAGRIVHVKGMDELPTARLLVARTENEAFEYTHTTVQDVVVAKEYAVASGEVKIYEQRKESSAVTGILSDQALCYILADSDKDWVFVESGDARGFVEKSRLVTGAAASQKVSDRGEKNMAIAQVLIAPQDNKACYYTLTSVKEASQAAKTREAMVNFALQFVGNPYVWGGTSLTNGADCSGFVQSVYANFGYSLPRVAEAQAGYGMQIPISSAEPGDLIFYARNGYVYHVSMYIGNGQVVQAANSRAGIITSGIGGNAVWATRVITD